MSEKLNHIRLFDGLSTEQLNVLEPLTQDIDFYNQERIFKDGEEAKFLWFVREGRIDLRYDLPSRVTSLKQTVSTVIKNRTFGWSSLVSPHQYRLSAYCATDYTALTKMNRDKLLELFQTHNDIGYVIMLNLTQVIANRFHSMQDEVATRAGHNVLNHW